MPNTLATAYVKMLPDFSDFHRRSKVDLSRAGSTIDVKAKADTRQLGRDVDREAKAVGTKAGRTLSGAMKIGLGAVAGTGALLGVGVAKALPGLYKATQLASDLNETVSASTVIFGNQAGAIQKWASNSARDIGLTRKEAINAATDFGDMFLQIGLTGGQAQKMSTGLTGLAADLASFKNADITDVLAAEQAAFRGEFDSLQRYIPNINAARVEKEALALTSKKSAKELTAEDKALATNAIIMADSARAQGDFSRTSGGLANQQRIFSAQLGETQTKLGAVFLPALLSVVKVGNEDLLPMLDDVITKYGPGFSQNISDWAEKIGPLISDLPGAVRGLKDMASGAGESGPALASLADSGQKLAPVVKQLLNDLPSIGDTLTVAASGMSFLADHTDELSKFMPLLVAGIIAYKASQIAVNVAQAASFPLKIVELNVNRQLVKSNQALVDSRAELVGATLAQNGAESVGLVTKVRSTVATIASTVASKAARTATIAWTGVQWLLNAALTANPIGLVIVAIAAFVGGIILAYKKSETFRAIVQFAFAKIAEGARFMWENVLKPTFRFLIMAWINVSEVIVKGAAKAFGWVPGIGPKLREAADKFEAFKRAANAALGGIKDKNVRVTATAVISGDQWRRRNANGTLGPIMRAAGGPISGPGTGTSDSIPAMLSNGEHVITAKEVQAAGGHSGIMAYRRSLRGYAGGGPVVDAAGDTDGLRSGATSLNRQLTGLAEAYGKRLRKQFDYLWAGNLGAGGWQKQWAAVHAQFPGATLNSAFRPGAITATGNSSYHSRGRAIDIGGPMSAVFEWIRSTYGPRTKELIYSPKNGRQLHNGAPHFYGEPTRSMHYDHVHWAYDNGGWLPPGGRGVNLSARPEPVFSAEQWEILKSNLGGGNTYVLQNDGVITTHDVEDWFVRVQSDAKRKGRI